jgi:ornithine carbamoyltransferase
VGAIVTREIDQTELDKYCALSSISIINSTNDDFVPLQALCDLYTIWEKKRTLEGIKLAYVGKGGNNAASLVMGAIKCGLEVSVATPEQFAIKKEHLEHAEQYGNIFVTDNPIKAVRDADVVYTDSYSYHSAISESDREILKPYQVNTALMSFAKHDAIFMHSLPASRGIEVTEDIIDGKMSVVLDQGENKLHTIKAVLALLIK